jgi:hypothetical protein
MTNFAKTLTCPTSYDLAEYSAGELDTFWQSIIKRHFASCDFCAAEAELYRRFPLTKYRPEPAPPIPEPLYQLAESILVK